MRRLRPNLPYVVLAACLVLATGVASLLFARLAQDHIDPNNHPMEDITWPLYQVQAEYLRTTRLVAKALLRPSTELRDAALQRYEIFMSRLEVVTEANIEQRLARRPELKPLVYKIVAAMTALDRAVQLAASPDEKLRIIEQRLDAEADLIQQMVLKTHLTFTDDRGVAETTLKTTTLRLASLFGVVVLAVLLFAAVTWRQFYRLEQSRDDLVEVSKRLEAERERAMLASKTKSTFLANMSHELRTPLNAIIGFADMIRGQVLGPATPVRYVEYAGDIHRSGQHLLSLVNDLLDLAKIEAGRMEIEPEWLDLRNECLAAVNTCAAETRQRGIALERVDVPCTVQVEVDQRALRQMLLNLLANAVKFTPKGGEIDLLSELAADGSLRLKIRDSGPGIAPEFIQHLMEPFVRGSAEALSGQQGTGLGLSITRRLVEQHGGCLELVSTVGKGTAAILTFPAARVMMTSDNPIGSTQALPAAQILAAPQAAD